MLSWQMTFCGQGEYLLSSLSSKKKRQVTYLADEV